MDPCTVNESYKLRIDMENGKTKSSIVLYRYCSPRIYKLARPSSRFFCCEVVGLMCLLKKRSGGVPGTDAFNS
jgi:hypothetical protein